MSEEIRVLTNSDVLQLRELRLEALKTDPIAFTQLYEIEITKANSWYIDLVNKNVVIGAFVDEKLCGMSIMTRYTSLKQRHKAYTWFTYVNPSTRGTGLARRIRQFTFSEALRTGITQCTSAVLSINEKIRKLNLSLGCEETYMERKAIKHEGVFYDLVHTIKYLDD